MPDRSYHEVKVSFYLTPAGAILPVNGTDTDAFRAAVETAILTANNIEGCRKELADLMTSEPFDVFTRWYVIDTILRRGGRFPLYATRDEAQRAREEMPVNA